MTLTIPPDIEKTLEESARDKGISTEQVALDTLKMNLSPLSSAVSDVTTDDEEQRQEALARIRSGYYAKLLGPSSLLQEKAEEKAREERHWQ